MMVGHQGLLGRDQTGDHADPRRARAFHATRSTSDMPLFKRLEIDSQSFCNRWCWFCPRTYDRSGAYLEQSGKPVLNQMPTAKILDLLDQAQAIGFCGLVTFNFYSEPLLDKRNIWLAQQARRRGMKPFVHTNGDVLKGDTELCKKVKEVYGYIVIGLYDLGTDQELEQAKGYWRNRLSGADLKFITIGVTGRSMGIPRVWVPTDRRLGVPDLVYSNAPCHHPLLRAIIRHDGEMCNCCEDTGGDFHLGNVHQESLEALWFSEKHRQVVGDLVAGRREKYRLCRNCPLSPTGPAAPGRKISFRRRHYRRDDEG